MFWCLTNTNKFEPCCIFRLKQRHFKLLLIDRLQSAALIFTFEAFEVVKVFLFEIPGQASGASRNGRIRHHQSERLDGEHLPGGMDEGRLYAEQSYQLRYVLP